VTPLSLSPLYYITVKDLIKQKEIQYSH